MTRPHPSHFEITQDEINNIYLQIAELRAKQIRPKRFREDYTVIVALIFVALCWLGAIMTGLIPSLFSKILGAILSFFLGVLWISHSSNLIQSFFFKINAKRAASDLSKLYATPLYKRFCHLKEAEEKYNSWLNQKTVQRKEAEIETEKRQKNAELEWSRWEREWNKQQQSFWLSLDGIGFEREMANLYRALGYEASLTSWSGDDGVDIHLKKLSKKSIVQCKAHNKPVGAVTVRELFGALHHFQADEAILACTAGFTASAINFAKGKPIKLIKLVDILKMQASIMEGVAKPPKPIPYPTQAEPPLPQPSCYTSPVNHNFTSLHTVTKLQHIASLAITFVFSTPIALGCLILFYSSHLETKTEKSVSKNTEVTISPTPLNKIYPSPYFHTPQPSPTKEASISQRILMEDVDPPEPHKDKQSVNDSLLATSDSPVSAPVILPPPRKAVTPDITNPPAVNKEVDSDSKNHLTTIPSSQLSREDQYRINKANQLKSLGLNIDWQKYSWSELSDIEMRIRKASELQKLGLNVNWQEHSWSEMNDWQQRIRKANDLKALGLNINWQEHSWSEMNDWQQRIRKANDLKKYDINVDWQKYTWSQLYELEQKARKK